MVSSSSLPLPARLLSLASCLLYTLRATLVVSEPGLLRGRPAVQHGANHWACGGNLVRRRGACQVYRVAFEESAAVLCVSVTVTVFVFVAFKGLPEWSGWGRRPKRWLVHEQENHKNMFWL